MKKVWLAGLLAAAGMVIAAAPANASINPDHPPTHLSLGWTCKDGVCVTCKAGAERFMGAWRVYNNDHGMQGGLCLRSTDNGYNFTILNNVPPGEVANPQVTIGWRPVDHDPQSGFPISVKHMGNITWHVGCTGSVPSWSVILCDVDIYMGNSTYWPGHPPWELVIANWNLNWPGHLPRIIRVEGRTYTYSQWMTGPTGHTWPILVMRRVGITRMAKVPITAIIRKLLHTRNLPYAVPRLILDMKYNPELGGGGRGLHVWARQ